MYTAIPKRRHSTSRKDLDEERQRRDKRRRWDPRRFLSSCLDPSYKEWASEREADGTRAFNPSSGLLHSPLLLLLLL